MVCKIGVTDSGPKGSRVRYLAKGRPQRVRTGGCQWSEEAEAVFFSALAASCNVSLSAKEAGFSLQTVYAHRRDRADFAEKWRAALEQGYLRLEMALLEAAIDSLAGVDFGEDRPIPAMTVEQAMGLLRAHHHTVHDTGKRGRGLAPRPRKLDDVRASILRKIAAMERAQAAARGEAE